MEMIYLYMEKTYWLKYYKKNLLIAYLFSLLASC